MVITVNNSASDALDYLSQLKSGKPLSTSNAAAQAQNVSIVQGAPTTNINAVRQTPNLVRVSSDVLSVLQETGSNSTTGTRLATLLGSGSGVLRREADVRAVKDALAGTLRAQVQAEAERNSLQQIIASRRKVIDAYSRNAITEAQKSLKENNGLIPGKA